MTPVRFWERDIDEARSTDMPSSALAPSFDPQRAPNPEDLDWRCRPCPDAEFDAARDELLTGDDIFSDEWPHQIKHPSKHLLDVARASYPARPAAAAPGVLPPSPGTSGAAAPLAQQQPGRGRDRAA